MTFLLIAFSNQTQNSNFLFVHLYMFFWDLWFVLLFFVFQHIIFALSSWKYFSIKRSLISSMNVRIFIKVWKWWINAISFVAKWIVKICKTNILKCSCLFLWVNIFNLFIYIYSLSVELLDNVYFRLQFLFNYYLYDIITFKDNVHFDYIISKMIYQSIRSLQIGCLLFDTFSDDNFQLHYTYSI